MTTMILVLFVLSCVVSMTALGVCWDFRERLKAVETLLDLTGRTYAHGLRVGDRVQHKVTARAGLVTALSGDTAQVCVADPIDATATKTLTTTAAEWALAGRAEISGLANL